MVALYEPLLLRRCRRRIRNEADARDVVQEVFATVVTKIEQFSLPAPAEDGTRRRAFRPWLGAILEFKILEHLRRRDATPAVGGTDALAVMAQVAAPGPGECSPPPEAGGPGDLEERAILLRRAIELAARDVAPKTWRAAWERLVEGRPAAEIASELGMTPGAVHVARTRVLKRAREILAPFGEEAGGAAPGDPTGA